MDGDILLWNNLKRSGGTNGWIVFWSPTTKVLMVGCLLHKAGMTLDAVWLHMAWPSERMNEGLCVAWKQKLWVLG